MKTNPNKIEEEEEEDPEKIHHDLVENFLKQNEKQINKNKKEFCLFVKLIKIKLDVYRDKINNIWIIDLF